MLISEALFVTSKRKFDLPLTVHLQCRQGNKIKTNYMQQITVFIDLQDQLNMFRTNICPSSGA
jgi:hypothetical protein